MPREEDVVKIIGLVGKSANASGREILASTLESTTSPAEVRAIS
jgi:hypothetical protein